MPRTPRPQQAEPDSKAPSTRGAPVSPGLRVSLQGALKLVALLAATVRAGALPLAEQPAPLSPLPPLSLMDVTGLACASGVCNALIGASNTATLFPAECPIVADTLAGMGTQDGKAGARDVVFQQPSNDENEYAFKSGADLLRVQPWSEICQPDQTGIWMEQALSSQKNLTARFINMVGKIRPDLPLQPDRPGSALVSMVNGMFSLGRQTSPKTIDSPWKPTTTLMLQGGVPMGELADDLLHRMQSRSPTLFVADKTLFVPLRMGHPVDRDVVLNHFLAQGYFIVEAGTRRSDSWRAVLFMPPTQDIVAAFGPYADQPVDGMSVRRPTGDAIRAFHKTYPHGEQPPGAGSSHGAGAVALMLGSWGISLFCGIGTRKPAQALREPKGVRDLKSPPARRNRPKPLPSPGNDTAQQQPPPMESKYPLPAAVHTPHSIGEVFDDVCKQLRRLDHRGQITKAGKLGLEAEAALDVGDPILASTLIRALSEIETDSTPLSRLLTSFGVSLSEITGALQGQIHSGWNTGAFIAELDRLQGCKTAIELAMPKKSYEGDEKGLRGSAQRPPRPTGGPRTGPTQGTGPTAPAPDHRSMGEARRRAVQFARQGHGTRLDDQIYIGGRPEATPHLHVGPDFLSLKLGNHHHVRIFTNGGDLKPANLAKAIAYARQNPVSPYLLDLLLFIENRPG